MELLAALLREGRITVAGGAAEITRTSLPPDLRLTLLRRLAELSPASAATLRLAAVLGRSFEVGDLALLADRSAVELLPELVEALGASVLEPSGDDRLAFRHELLREAIYEDLAPGLRAVLHLEAGRVLGRAGAPALKVAGHLTLGATRGDTKAVEWLRRAARDAFGRTPSVSLQLLRRVVELTLPTDGGRAADGVELMHALMWRGRSDEALAIGEEISDGALDVAMESELRLALTWALLLAARPHAARAQVERALSCPSRPRGGGTPSRSRKRSRATAPGTLTARSRLQRSRWTTQSGRAATPSPARRSLSSRRSPARGDTRTTRSRWPSARGNRSGHGEAIRWPSLLVLAAALMDADRFADAEAQLRAGEQRSIDFGGVWNLPLYRCRLAQLRFVSGRWEECLAEVAAGRSLADESGVRFASAESLALRGLISLHRNDLAAAEAALDEREADADPILTPGAEWVVWARALLEEARGDRARAVDLLRGRWDGLERVAPWSFTLIGPDHVRMLLAEGMVERADGVARDVERVALRMRSDSARAAALRCRGMVAANSGLVLQGTALLRELGRPLALAQSAEEAGTLLIQAGRVAEGRPHLEGAYRMFAGLGAMRDQARTGASLRRLGARFGSRGPRRARPDSGCESLTGAERAVVDLGAAGLSNSEIARRLFVSPRTVETHLAHAFKKLGVRSRAGLSGAIRPYEGGARAPHVDRP